MRKLTAARSAPSAAGHGDYHRPMPEATHLTLAHSPDADDVVMWWPITGRRHADGSRFEGADGQPAIDTGGIEFQPIGEDVQVLNKRAIEVGDLDITAISAHAYPYLADRYRITACGGSFGEGYGPKVVVRDDDRRFSLGDPHRLTGDDVKVAVPGRHTTACLTLSLLLDAENGPPFEFVEMRFDKIIEAVRTGEVDAGVLIHEAQLTFESQGLRMLAELGVWWSEAMGTPLPLGLNVIKREVGTEARLVDVAAVSDTLKGSVLHARQPVESEAAAAARARTAFSPVPVSPSPSPSPLPASLSAASATASSDRRGQ